MPLAAGAPYGIGPTNLESVSAVTATATVVLGTIRYEGGAKYQYVYNAGGAQISQRNICILSATTGYSVTVSSLSGADNVAAKPFGVCAHATATTATYFWAMRRGFCTLISSGSTAILAGYPIIPGADGSSDAATGGTGMTSMCAVFGKAMTATTTAGSFAAYVTCD
jgi:hypothetical protein